MVRDALGIATAGLTPTATGATHRTASPRHALALVATGAAKARAPPMPDNALRIAERRSNSLTSWHVVQRACTVH